MSDWTSERKEMPGVSCKGSKGRRKPWWWELGRRFTWPRRERRFQVREESPMGSTKPPGTWSHWGLFMLLQNSLRTSNFLSSCFQRKMRQSRTQRRHMRTAAWSSLQVGFQLFRWALDQSWEVKNLTSEFQTVPYTTAMSFQDLAGSHHK